VGDEEIGRVALLSIHPEFAYAILSGTKTVEFRKRPVAPDVTHVIVYATAPVSGVVGAFSVVAQHTTSPGALWRRFSRTAGISRTGFFSYYEDRASATGIEVGATVRTPRPLPLADSIGVSRPPQSFQYVTGDRAKRAIRSMN
jgi:predicted transcriptional regulator